MGVKRFDDPPGKRRCASSLANGSSCGIMCAMVEADQSSWTDRDVEAHWDRVAPVYGAENDKVKAAHDQRFLTGVAHLALSSNARVLNITSRDGEADDYIRQAEPSSWIVNAEISQGLMDAAAQARPHLRQVKLSSYSQLPFADAEFDRVLTLETLEHAAEPLAFLRELHRVSVPAARMVLSCPPATSELPYRVYTALFGGHGEGPHRFPPSKQVKEWFRATGWKLLIHKGCVLIPVGPAWLRGWGENIIGRFQGTFVSELGIRQFYVCEKS